MVCLESPVTVIPNKVVICLVFGFCDVTTTSALTKIKKFGFLYKSIGKLGFWPNIAPTSHFDWNCLLKYERK